MHWLEAIQQSSKQTAVRVDGSGLKTVRYVDGSGDKEFGLDKHLAKAEMRHLEGFLDWMPLDPIPAVPAQEPSLRKKTQDAMERLNYKLMHFVHDGWVPFLRALDMIAMECFLNKTENPDVETLRTALKKLKETGVLE